MSNLSGSLSGDGRVSGAVVGSLLQKPDLPRECMRAVEDCYRLTVCLGSPRLKAWRDTAQGVSRTSGTSWCGQCHQGWSSCGECRPLWAGSRSGLSAAQKPLGRPYLPFLRECFQGERGSLRSTFVLDGAPSGNASLAGQGHRHAVSSNWLRPPLICPTEGTPLS